ncbi:hypothetical protein AB3U99_11670 [Niallia sp. JL1B1071]
MATFVKKEDQVLDFMDDLQDIIQKTISEKNLTPDEIKEALDYKRR